MNRVKLGINSRLCRLNQRSFSENLAQSSVLYIILVVVCIIYFAMAYYFFHSLWYHKLFALASTLIFGYSLQDLYFEYLEVRVKKALPKTTKKLSHYYTHYNGNLIPALKETEDKCPVEVRRYLVKIRKALLTGKPKEEIEALKNSFPFVWFRMLASITYMAKEKGTGAPEAGRESIQAGRSNMIGRSLSKITNILSFINVQQGYNDAELKYIQIFLYFAPLLFIVASDWVNARILVEMNMQDVYQGIKAQNLKSYLFITSNLSALFIHWMRKQQI